MSSFMAALTHPDAPMAHPVGAEPGHHSPGQPQLPEFTALPREGQVEYYSGLRRSMLNTLVLPCKSNDFKPPVKSINMRRPGCAKGKRLICLEGTFGTQKGLLTYLRSLRDAIPADTALQPAGGN